MRSLDHSSGPSRRFLATADVGLADGCGACRSLRAKPVSPPRNKNVAAVERGLEWLKKGQAKDGHWESPGGKYNTAVNLVILQLEKGLLPLYQR